VFAFDGAERTPDAVKILVEATDLIRAGALGDQDRRRSPNRERGLGLTRRGRIADQ
jgi:hypothetical protein